MPVSYTHLDVYKRQDHDSIVIALPYFVKAFEKGICFFAYHFNNFAINSVVEQDVYKRQVPHPHILGRNLIEDISFKVRAGQVVGLAGLVGAGRTEVVSAIYGMFQPSAGTITMNGKPVKIRNTTDAVNQGIALASEDRKKYGLNFVWDIKKNIAVSNLDAISTAGIFISGQKEDKRSRRYFDEMHIKAPSLKTKVGTLSGGNQQKVVIARCLNACLLYTSCS